jgi:predicted lipoprotein with Yx(FWY)xxD motif
MSIAKKVLGFVAVAAVLVVLFPAPAGACTPEVNATLKDQTHDEGRGMTMYKFQVEVGQRGGSDCVAINYQLVLQIETAAGEDLTIPLRKHVKVHGESVNMVLQHQMPSDDLLASWEVTEVQCHACAPGD